MSRRRPVALAVQLLVATGGFAAPWTAALAQSSTSLPAVTVQGELDKGYSATRSTTATKTDTPLIDTPQSISVVTKDQIRDQASQGLAEALRYVPGVGFAQGEGNRETPIFRGIATTADFYIDGVRDDVQYYRDLYNIERVEVLRGPNAMIFGRGATGGLISRVSKQANWTPLMAASVSLGSDSNKRVAVDLNQAINENFAFRLNAMHEDSDSYRDGVFVRRTGINPTLSWKATNRTLVTAGYEHFRDDRIADRGISSYQGRPVKTDPSTFFGNASNSPTWSRLDAFNLSVEHEFGAGLALRNRLRVADQDKFYQNVFPGAVNAAGTTVSIAAYNNATTRKSVFNQTDLTYNLQTGAVRHKLLAGVELGRQETTNFRETGYFPGDLTSVSVPLSNPVTNLPVAFRQSATDADNSGTSKVAAFYVQDQIELSPQWQIVGGLRLDHFTADLTNKRNGQQFDSSDNLLSPRVGVIYKAQPNLALYANYSIAHQPRAGEQLASLSASNAALSPEKFKNYELGAKWDVQPNLAVTAAIFRLDRTNVVILDPSDPTNTRTILSDGQRTEGVELGVSGSVTAAWSVAGGYTYSDARFKGRTAATLRPDGAVALVPRHTFSLWNRYDFTPVWGAGLGVIHRTKSFAANELAAAASNVELPGYTRVDAAVFFKINKNLGLQLNVENLFDKEYYVNAHSNTNITPGSPRAYRVALNASF
ncbi:TonB-dependent receptor [Pseudorhodoferax sp.]|uniref:TonB-dependent receptor n=1 Tax=Pseudorhodoferax sp. TaxID=1993553 RepID=UPI002DD67943|nr:TonB-dependent siderophore receptor [Pseudorhodoferax sp.]